MAQQSAATPNNLNDAYSALKEAMPLDTSKHPRFKLNRFLKKPLEQVLSQKMISGFTGLAILEGNHTGSPTFPNPLGGAVAWNATQTAEYNNRNTACSQCITSLINPKCSLYNDVQLYDDDPKTLLQVILDEKTRPLTHTEVTERIKLYETFALIENDHQAPEGWCIDTCVSEFFDRFLMEAEDRDYDEQRFLNDILVTTRWPDALKSDARRFADIVKINNNRNYQYPAILPHRHKFRWWNPAAHGGAAYVTTTGLGGGATAHPYAGRINWRKIRDKFQELAKEKYLDGSWLPNKPFRVLNLVDTIDDTEAEPYVNAAGKGSRFNSRRDGKGNGPKGKGAPYSKGGGRGLGNKSRDGSGRMSPSKHSIPAAVTDRGTAVICNKCGGIGHMPYQCPTPHNGITVPRNTLLGITFPHLSENPLYKFFKAKSANQADTSNDDDGQKEERERAETDAAYEKIMATVQDKPADQISSPVVNQVEDNGEGDEHEARWDEDEADWYNRQE
jgi:hypothetical protein